MTRKECLDKAAECVMQNRQDQYGDVEDCFKKIARLWNAYLPSTIELEPFDVACMMALLKIARIQANPKHGDSWVDLAGYAACGADIAVPEPFRYDKPETESGCCQNGNDHSPEASAEPEFKPGDPVEWFSFGRKDAEADGWHPAFYLCKAGDPNYHVVQDIDGMYHVVNYANIRSPEAMYRPGDKVEALSFDGSRWEDAVVERTEVASGQWHCTVRLTSGERHCLPVAGSIRRPSRAGDKAGGNHPENPDSSPEFKRGDKVEVQMAPDSSTWASAVITAVYRNKDTCEWRYCVDFEDGWAHVVVPSARVRPVAAPKAEGCEALVEKDARQTKEELFQHIVDCNPANYKPRNLWEGLTRLNINPTFKKKEW